MSKFAEQARLHATAVAIGDSAVVMLGPSGSGKSALALQLIALGAKLVADDQCVFSMIKETLMVAAPKTLPPLIEARGIGLLKVPVVETAAVVLAIDMDQMSQDRLPTAKFKEILDHKVKMIDKSEGAHFPAAILLYLRHGIAT